METMIFNYGFGDQIAESGVNEEILSSRVIPDYSHGHGNGDDINHSTSVSHIMFQINPVLIKVVEHLNHTNSSICASEIKCFGKSGLPAFTR